MITYHQEKMPVLPAHWAELYPLVVSHIAGEILTGVKPEGVSTSLAWRVKETIADSKMFVRMSRESRGRATAEQWLLGVVQGRDRCECAQSAWRTAGNR